MCKLSDEVDDQVEPHDSQDDQYMKQAMDEAKLSPDGDVQVCTLTVNLSIQYTRTHKPDTVL